VELSITYLGAHSVPAGSTAEQATEDIINNHLPALVEMQRKGELSVDNIDVFLEKGVFDREQTRRILRVCYDIE
jgi:imidazolonepropionase